MGRMHHFLEKDDGDTRKKRQSAKEKVCYEKYKD